MQGHSKPVDWWSYGVLLFEMMAGYPPFYDDDITNTYKKILKHQYVFPAHFSFAARDLIRKLLEVCTRYCAHAMRPCNTDAEYLDNA